MADDHGATTVIERDLAAIVQTLPTVTPDPETFRRCRALGRRNRWRRLLTVTAVPVLLVGSVLGWATVHASGSGPIVGPVIAANPSPTSRPLQPLSKIHTLDVAGLPAGTKLAGTGSLIGLTWRSYILPSAPYDRLVMTALVGQSRDAWPWGLGVSQTQINVHGDPGLLTRLNKGARVDWVNVRQHVSYTIIDESGTLTRDALLNIAGSLRAS